MSRSKVDWAGIIVSFGSEWSEVCQSIDGCSTMDFEVSGSGRQNHK